MDLRFRWFDLKLTHWWMISSGVGPGGGGGTDLFRVIFVELRDADGVIGLGEAAPSTRYDEGIESNLDFLSQVDPKRLSFSDLGASQRYLEELAPGQQSAKGALNIALVDGASRRDGKSVSEYLGFSFREKHHVTSFSIGIDRPEKIREKVAEAEEFPILKLKVGSPNDPENLAALRAVAPLKRVRVDGNEAWKTKEEALRHLEWLAQDGLVEFVEQPMAATSAPKDLAWLKERSPLPIMADESYQSADDLALCADCFHAVNVKLAKMGGVTPSALALKAARQVGLKTMLGCMIESSVLISAAAHLAELTDYLDLDGNLLITNDPYLGVTAEKGVLSFAETPEKVGLCVRARSTDPLEANGKAN